MTIASDYRHSITIKKDVPTGIGSRGQDDYTTTTIGSVRAKIEDLTGRKLEIARQQVATATHEITIRYLENVDSFCKVVFNNRTFQIGSVVNRMQNNFEMTILCTEII